VQISGVKCQFRISATPKTLRPSNRLVLAELSTNQLNGHFTFDVDPQVFLKTSQLSDTNFEHHIHKMVENFSF